MDLRSDLPTSPERSGQVHYLLVRRWREGFELLRSDCPEGDRREGVVRIFASREAAEEFLGGRAGGDEWCVKGFSSGEVISLLFAFEEREVFWAAGPMSRDDFVDLLIEN